MNMGQGGAVIRVPVWCCMECNKHTLVSFAKVMVMVRKVIFNFLKFTGEC